MVRPRGGIDSNLHEGRVMNSNNIKAALAHIATASPMHHKGDGLPEDRVADWVSGEAALAFAMYERAVMDYFGFQCGNKVTEREKPTARLMAVKGYIVTAKGPKNILEQLGINPAWAWTQLQTAVNYTKLKEAA